MDKNNDIQVNKVSKWEAAPKNMGTLFTYIDLVIGMACSLPSEIRVNLYDLMDKTFDEYNKLEAAYEEACDDIYQHDEENRALRKQRKELVVDNDNLRQERNRHIDLLDKLRMALENKGIYCEWNEAALEWHLYGKNKLFDELREHYEEELRIREKEKDDKDELIDELNSKIRMLKLSEIMFSSHYGLNNTEDELIKKIETLEKENKELRMTLAMCERDANMARELCHTVAFNAERARNKTPWFNE